jgi:protease IV
MAKTSDYRLAEYPRPKTLLELIFGDYKKSMQIKAMKEELGQEGFKTYTAVKKVKAMVGIMQARLPIGFSIQ